MDLVNAFALIALFVGIYMGMMFCGYVLDKVLRKIFKRGIFPEKYFESSPSTASKSGLEVMSWRSSSVTRH